MRSVKPGAAGHRRDRIKGGSTVPRPLRLPLSYRPAASPRRRQVQRPHATIRPPTARGVLAGPGRLHTGGALGRRRSRRAGRTGTADWSSRRRRHRRPDWHLRRRHPDAAVERRQRGDAVDGRHHGRGRAVGPGRGGTAAALRQDSPRSAGPARQPRRAVRWPRGRRVRSSTGHRRARAWPRRLAAPNVNLASLGQDTNSLPPDTMGDIGPTQYLVGINGRIRTVSKATGLADGVLNASFNTFFASVRNGAGTSDPRVRFDRRTGRWFVAMINVGDPQSLPAGDERHRHHHRRHGVVVLPVDQHPHPGRRRRRRVVPGRLSVARHRRGRALSRREPVLRRDHQRARLRLDLDLRRAQEHAPHRLAERGRSSTACCRTDRAPGRTRRRASTTSTTTRARATSSASTTPPSDR